MRVKVWNVLEGPIAVEELDESYDAPDGAKYLLVCKAEADGVLADDHFWFEHFDDAYNWKTHFLTDIEPIVIDMADQHGYN